MGIRTRQVHLLRRPSGPATPQDFRTVEVVLPDLQDGQVLVRNLWMSVDPYMRRNMEAVAKDLEPWALDQPLDGPSIGRVVESRHPDFAPGELVESLSGWQEHFISHGAPFVPFLSSSDALVRRAIPGANPRDYVGILGVASLTAYAAMVCLSRAQAGETCVVSSGAGAVGSVACQIGRIRGLRVVASAGSAEKVSWLRDELCVDEAFDYRARAVGDALREACPDGIDLVLENASGEHLSACLPLMNPLKEVLISGFVSIYSTGGRVPPFENFEYVLDRFLTLRSFRFMDSLHAYDRFAADMLAWRQDRKMVFRESVFDGLAAAPEALCALFGHEVTGKVLVRIGDDA